MNDDLISRETAANCAENYEPQHEANAAIARQVAKNIARLIRELPATETEPVAWTPKRHLDDMASGSAIFLRGYSAPGDGYADWAPLYLRALPAALSPEPAPVAPATEPVAWTGSGSMMALKDGREGYIFPRQADAHPIPLYSHPTDADLRAEVARLREALREGDA